MGFTVKLVASGLGPGKDRPRYLAPLTVITFLVLALLIGAVSPFIGVTGSAVIAAILLLGLIALAVRGRQDIAALSLAALLLVPMILSVVSKAAGISLAGSWQVVPLVMSVFGVAMFAKAVKADAMLRCFLFAFLLFLVWVVASSVIGRTRPAAGVYQFLSNLKPLLLVVLGFAIAWDRGVDKVLRRMAHWLWLPLTVMVAFEWLAPSVYFQIFPGDGGSKASTDPTGLLPSRAVGLFEHPSILATTAASFCILSAAYRVSADGKVKRIYLLLMFAYLALIFSTVQRQELAACVLALILMAIVASKSAIFGKLIIAFFGVAISAAVFWTIFSQNIGEEIRLWGLGSAQAIQHPRAQIMVGAWRLASEYFPFGAGLGTFGGAGAAKFDDSVYLELGFGGYWWFGREDFLMDTYWPNSIAEGGYIAAFLLLSAYSFLLMAAVRVTRCAGRQSAASTYGLAAVGGISYMLMLSLTSPAFQDPRLFLLPAAFLGIGYGASRAQSLPR